MMYFQPYCGYHIYLPVAAPILELESIFAGFEEPSKQFIRWTEQFLTNNKADPCHSSSLSFKNKFAVINEKGEIVNVPESAEVRIVQKWNGVRPSIKQLLPDFHIFLADSKLKEIHRNRKSQKHSLRYVNSHNHKIRYIETLLETPIPEHRKYTLRLIVAPYLINVRKLCYEDALSIIKEWLDRCDKLKPLVSVNSRIKSYMSAAARVGYLPKSLSDLKTENKELADLISRQIK